VKGAAQQASATAVVGVEIACPDLSRILREAEGRVGRPRDIGIERAGQKEHGAVDHGTPFRVFRIKLIEPVLIAEILHDGAALPDDTLRQALGLDHRRQMGRVLGRVFVRARLSPRIILGEIELGRTQENADGHVVDAGLQHVELDGRHAFLLEPLILLGGLRGRFSSPKCHGFLLQALPLVGLKGVSRQTVLGEALGRTLHQELDGVRQMNFADRAVAPGGAKQVRFVEHFGIAETRRRREFPGRELDQDSHWILEIDGVENVPVANASVLDPARIESCDSLREHGARNVEHDVVDAAYISRRATRHRFAILAREHRDAPPVPGKKAFA
jgi:hypothetical protein